MPPFKDLLESVHEPLEQAWFTRYERDQLELLIKASTAVSLKRIADVLERQEVRNGG